MKCDYCGNKFHDNGRGACASCGAPAPDVPREQAWNDWPGVISSCYVPASAYGFVPGIEEKPSLEKWQWNHRTE